jgi:hypothetical protein
VLRKAKGDHERLVALMRVRHPAGVTGVDSTANLESEVYGQVRQHTTLEVKGRREWP